MTLQSKGRGQAGFAEAIASGPAGSWQDHPHGFERISMIAETFDRSLRALARRTPFQPFAVELMSGGRIEVDHPEALVFRGGVAVTISSDGVPTLFDHHGVVRLIGETEKADRAPQGGTA